MTATSSCGTSVDTAFACSTANMHITLPCVLNVDYIRPFVFLTPSPFLLFSYSDKNDEESEKQLVVLSKRVQAAANRLISHRSKVRSQRKPRGHGGKFSQWNDNLLPGCPLVMLASRTTRTLIGLLNVLLRASYPLLVRELLHIIRSTQKNTPHGVK